jgi:hypothetical protein
VKVVAVALSIIVAAALAAFLVFVALPPLQAPPPQYAPASAMQKAAQPAPAGAPAVIRVATKPQQTAAQSDAEIIITLVRSIFVAVHQANVTQNYSVLRDLGTPAFRERNSVADLARIFTSIRNRNIDLGSAAVAEPKLAKAELNKDKQLHLAGTIATRPVATAFELLLAPIEGVWRIQGIALIPVQPGSQPAPKPPPKR